jgi:hypothetical protein
MLILVAYGKKTLKPKKNNSSVRFYITYVRILGGLIKKNAFNDKGSGVK